MTQTKTVRMLTPLLLVSVLFLVTGCHIGPHSKKSPSPNSTPATSSNAAFTLNAFARSASQATTPIASERRHAFLNQYVPMLKNQIAPSLHLTTDQLTQELQAGQTLTAIASTQGISATQLPTLLASALSTTLTPAVQAGQITQQRLDQLKTRVAQNPNGLDTLLTQ
jgi:hypothetical protein